MTERLLSLLIEFDEMGFEPTTLCPDPEKYAIEWREKVRAEFERVEAENADLTVKNEILQRDVENLTRTLEEGGEEYRALQAENAALKARLKKAVELKAKVGDVIYMPWVYDRNDGIATLQIIGSDFHNDEIIYITDFESDSAYYRKKYKHGIFSDSDFNSIVFTDRAKAEFRLAELKRGNE